MGLDGVVERQPDVVYGVMSRISGNSIKALFFDA